MMRPSMMEYPADLFLDSLNPVNFDRDEDDDAYSSHPNMATRRGALEKVLNAQKCSGSNKFIESSAAFITIRKIARFETIRLQLQERSYCFAYYNAFVLLQEDSTNSYLKTCVGKALYGLAKYKNNGDYNSITKSYYKVEGNQQQCYYFFTKMKAPQLNLLALRYLYDLSQTDSSYLIIAMRNDLADEAIRLNDIHYEDLKNATAIYKRALDKKDTIKTTDTANVVNQNPNKAVGTSSNPNAFVSKYDKLRIDKQKQEEARLKGKEADNSKFYLLAFSDIIESAEVQAFFSNAERTSADRIVTEERRKQKKQEENALSDEAYARREAKETTEIRTKKLGIDTVVFVDPYFMELDDYNYPVFVTSENTERELPALLIKDAAPFKMQTNVICPKTFGANDVELYNELACMNEWTTERVAHEDLNFLCLSTDKVLPLTMKYHTHHFCYIRIYGYDHLTYYYTLMYDITTGYEEINLEQKKVQKARTPLIESLFNTTLKTIKGTRNKRVD